MKPISYPRLDVELVNHPVLSSFIWVIDWDLVIVVARSGTTRPSASLDADARARLLREVRTDEDLVNIGLPHPAVLGTRTRYYDKFDSAIHGDMLGRHGRRLLHRSPTDRDPFDLDDRDRQISTDELEKRLCRDDECSGTHHWLRLEPEHRAFLLLWHVNPATGAVVPPQPAVLY